MKVLGSVGLSPSSVQPVTLFADVFTTVLAAETGGIDMLSCPNGGSPHYTTWGMTPTSTNIVHADGIDLPATV